MPECDQTDVFLDGETSVRPIRDRGEARYLELINSVSILLCYAVLVLPLVLSLATILASGLESLVCVFICLHTTGHS